MNCEQVARRIDDYLDGALGEDEGQLLAAHVSGCSECSARYAALMRTVAVLEELPAMEAPEELVPETLVRVPGRNVAMVGWALGLTGAAATAGIVVVVLWVLGQLPTWWAALGAWGRVLGGMAAQGALASAQVLTLLGEACARPLLYGLLIDVALLGASILVLVAWRRAWAGTAMLPLC